jgi:fructosamine-3-kinase
MQKVVFTNEPKLSEFEIQKDFNERRLKLVPYIKDFVSAHERFKDQDVKITFSDKGVGSLVSIIGTLIEKLVLKIPLSLTFAEGEGLFLSVWRNAGIKVPDVIEEGKIYGHSYILYTYIDAPLLSDKYTSEELVKQGKLYEMGQILRRMHEPKAEGYGKVVNGKAEFERFEDLFSWPKVQKNIEYVKEEKLITEEHGSLTRVVQILKDFVNENKRSSYCHDDFGASNIFATNPMTVFDPNPFFNNGYLDLGRSIVNSVAKDFYPKELIEGYFGSEDYNRKALHASVFLNACMKLPSIHKKNKTEMLQNIQKHLADNRILT